MRDDKDRSSKWLIQHHGDDLLRLGGVKIPILKWRSLSPEVVQPKQLPDGLLEVTFVGQERPDLFILEIATYPDLRVEEQIRRDMMAVYLDRRVLPEILTLVLQPRGNYRVPSATALDSRLGFGRIEVSSRVVELWTLPADEMLAANEVGLIPWIPLMQFSGEPEVLFQECRNRIDRDARPEEHANLLAVAQVLAQLRYNQLDLLGIFGGSKVMIESPLIQEIVDQTRKDTLVKANQNSILLFLEGRFGEKSLSLADQIKTITDEKKLEKLNKQAGRVPNLDEFKKLLS